MILLLGLYSQDVQGHSLEHFSFSLRKISSVQLGAKGQRSTHRRHSAQLKLCLPLFSLSPLPALLPALPGSAADVLLIGNGGGCIDSEDSELEVSTSSGGITAKIIRRVGS